MAYNQLGHQFSGTSTNYGYEVQGNNFSAGGNNVININAKDTDAKDRKRCLQSLFTTDPADDRAKYISFRGRVVPGTCNWLLKDPKFQSWTAAQTRSQLLWVSGNAGTGKTMLSIFLTDELERLRNMRAMVLYYFCEGRDQKRNSSINILRGLCYTLVRKRPTLIKYLLSEYDIQEDTLFSPTSIEAMWRIFESMIKDPETGPIFCVIDGVDECQTSSQEHLEHFIRKLATFFAVESSLAGGMGAMSIGGQAQSPQSAEQPGWMLKVALVSRDQPQFLHEALRQFSHITLGNQSSTKSDGPAAAPTTGAPVQQSNLSHGYVPPTTVNTQMQHAVPEGRPIQDNLAPQFGGYTASSVDLPSTTEMPTLDVGAPPIKQNMNTSNSPVYPGVASPMTTSGITPPTNSYPPFGPSPNESSANEYSDALGIYISAKVDELAQQKNFGEKERFSLKDDLTRRGNGTFLWVDMAIDQLSRAQSYDAHATLGDLPDGLEDMYLRLLRNIPPEIAHVAAFVLRWVSTTFTPLKTTELNIVYWFLSQQQHDGDLPPMSEELQSAIEWLGGILAVSEESEIGLAHETGKDFLTSEMSPLRADPQLNYLWVDSVAAHGEIASACLSYLEGHRVHQGFDLHDNEINLFSGKSHIWFEDAWEKSDSIIEWFPFLPYAILNWPDHLRQAHTQVNLQSEFFGHKSKLRRHWWKSYWSFKTSSDPDSCTMSTLLHMVAFCNLLSIAEQLSLAPDFRQTIDKSDGEMSTAAYVAACRGSTEVLKFLLDHGAKEYYFGEHLLGSAARRGQLQTVSMLLDRGTQVDLASKDNIGHKAVRGLLRKTPGLIDMISRVTEEVDQSAIAINAVDYGGNVSPLEYAATGGHETVVRFLLSRGANIHHVTNSSWTVMHFAAWGGSPTVMQLLLDSGAQLNGMTAQGWLPIHASTYRGKSGAITFLLRLGVNVNAMAKDRSTPLHIAAERNEEASARTLLAAGAHVDAINGKGRTALHVAASLGNVEVIKALLDFGANKNAIAGSKDTPLRLAKGGSKGSVAHVLNSYVPQKPQSQRLISTASTLPPQYPSSPVVQTPQAPPPTSPISSSAMPNSWPSEKAQWQAAAPGGPNSPPLMQPQASHVPQAQTNTYPSTQSPPAYTPSSANTSLPATTPSPHSHPHSPRQSISSPSEQQSHGPWPRAQQAQMYPTGAFVQETPLSPTDAAPFAAPTGSHDTPQGAPMPYFQSKPQMYPNQRMSVSDQPPGSVYTQPASPYQASHMSPLSSPHPQSHAYGSQPLVSSPPTYVHSPAVSSPPDQSYFQPPLNMPQLPSPTAQPHISPQPTPNSQHYAQHMPMPPAQQYTPPPPAAVPQQYVPQNITPQGASSQQYNRYASPQATPAPQQYSQPAFSPPPTHTPQLYQQYSTAPPSTAPGAYGYTPASQPFHQPQPGMPLYQQQQQQQAQPYWAPPPAPEYVAPQAGNGWQAPPTGYVQTGGSLGGGSRTSRLMDGAASAGQKLNSFVGGRLPFGKK